jgi:phage shock protein A
MGLLDRILRRGADADEPDPAEELERWAREQAVRIDAARSAVARITAARVRLDLAIANLRSRGDRPAAAELPGLREERADLQARERALGDEVRHLEKEVAAVRARGERLRAAHAAAEARAEVRVAAAAVARELGELNLAALRAQEAVDRSHARAEALDEILGSRELPDERPST